MEIQLSKALSPINLTLVGLKKLTEILLLNTKTTDAPVTEADTLKVAQLIIDHAIDNEIIYSYNYGMEIHGIENVIDWYDCLIDWEFTALEKYAPVLNKEMIEEITNAFRHFNGCLVDTE
jgi:hypothetical protein